MLKTLKKNGNEFSVKYHFNTDEVPTTCTVDEVYNLDTAEEVTVKESPFHLYELHNLIREN